MGLLVNMITKSQGYETLKTDKNNLYELIKKVIYDCQNEKDYKELKDTLTVNILVGVKRYDSSSNNWSLTFDNPAKVRGTSLIPEIRVFDHFNKKIYVYKGPVKSIRDDAKALINNIMQNGSSNNTSSEQNNNDNVVEKYVFTDEVKEEKTVEKKVDTVICPVCGLETSSKSKKCDFCGSEILSEQKFESDEESAISEEDNQEISLDTPENNEIQIEEEKKIEIEEEITEIFCPYCGKKIQKKNKFCNFCGKQNMFA